MTDATTTQPRRACGSPRAARNRSRSATRPCGPSNKRFSCPITHELMLDPVMCSDGQTFDRASIFRWFAQCDAEGRVCTSPTTGAVLTSDALLPNVLVRAMMEDAGIETQASAYRGGLSHTGAHACFCAPRKPLTAPQTHRSSIADLTHFPPHDLTHFPPHGLDAHTARPLPRRDRW